MRKIFEKRNSVLFVALSLVFTMTAYAAEPQASPGDKQMIESAMSAAPAKVGKDATIVAIEADGTMRVLRQGMNAFTCMPDNPGTPGPDPMCMDNNAMEWVNAWIAHQTPPPGAVGLMYMLKGGTDASNTDPYADKPKPGNHWIETGPHVMITGADDGFYDLYPKLADPDTASPYVMWADTPYRHLMVPVK